MLLMDLFWYWVRPRWHLYVNISWSSSRNTNGKHFDRSYIFVLIIYLCGTYIQFYRHFGNKNAGFQHFLLVGPWSCDDMAQIAAIEEAWSPLLLRIAYPYAVCIQSIIGSVKRPYFYNYVMWCSTVFAHNQCNLPFWPPVFIFPQDTWDNFGMNVQQVVEESQNAYNGFRGVAGGGGGEGVRWVRTHPLKFESFPFSKIKLIKLKFWKSGPHLRRRVVHLGPKYSQD